MDFQAKIEKLKQYENECYRVCVYLLGDNRSAYLAAEETMFDLFGNEPFWQAEEAARRKMIRRFAAFRSLQIRKTAG